MFTAGKTNACLAHYFVARTRDRPQFSKHVLKILQVSRQTFHEGNCYIIVLMNMFATTCSEVISLGSVNCLKMSPNCTILPSFFKITAYVLLSKRSYLAISFFC